MAINKLSNRFINQSWDHGGYFVELPPRKPYFDLAETPKELFCLTAKEIACANYGWIMRFYINDVS